MTGPFGPSRRDLIRAAVAGSVGLAAGVERLGAVAQQRSEVLIRGGRVVNADRSEETDVRIVGETIAEVGRGLRPGTGARVIEAAGRLVVPGGIDPHTHIDGSFADDLRSGSEAALAGGITTVGTFAFSEPGQSVLGAVERLAAEARRLAIADVFLHGAAWPPAAAVREALPRLAAAGHPSFKLFMPMPDFSAHLADVIRLLETARDAGVVSLVHCEDATLLEAAVRRLAAENKTSLRYYADSRPVVAEVAATQQAASWCESTGAPMYVVHLSSARALEACRAARQAGFPFMVETRPLYLHLTSEKMDGPDGPLYVGQPPLRSRADGDALWAGLADGTIDVLATDHAPWTRAQKLDPALTVTNLRPGVSDLQFMLPMYFSEGVGKRNLPLERFVATTSTNPARIFGLHPAKGVIQPGSDADIVIWDPSLTDTVRAAADRSKSDYTAYEGWRVTGWPTLTLRRGQIVYQDGRVTGAPGSGRLAKRTPWRGER